MAEPMWVGLEVGGTLHASLVDEFIKLIYEDLDETECITKEDLFSSTTSLSLYGKADYGLCENITKFCREHGLTYIVNVEACNEYNACTTFYVPGMEDSETYNTDSNENAVVRTSALRPLFDFMLAFMDKNDKALPLFLNNPAVADIVKECLNQPSNTTDILREHIKKLLPNEAPKEVPPLIVIKTFN